MDEKIKNTIKLSKQIRKDVLYLSYLKKTAHLGSSLSCADIISYVYQTVVKKNSQNKFILSKGHAATSLYSALFRKKFISKKIFMSYCNPGSLLEEHPSPKINGVECATGSLGHGLPFGCGIALANKIKGNDYKTLVLISDGECNEGTTWESALFAASQRLSNLVLFIDYNKWQATGRSEEIMMIKPLHEKFKSFGWDAIVIDGNNIKQIDKAFLKRNKRPKVIVANTIKGKGVSVMEDNNNWHYRSPSKLEIDLFLKEIK